MMYYTPHWPGHATPDDHLTCQLVGITYLYTLAMTAVLLRAHVDLPSRQVCKLAYVASQRP